MIEGIGRMQQITAAPPEAGARAGDQRAGARPERTAGDEAQAMSLAKVSADMAASPPVDAAKVASLREAIADGRYKHDPQAIAEAIMAQGGL
ncbi:hypothetical protein GCM10007973_18660 [Polymorphobacter multimanifer]|uniref:Negative regulator of flagellin synthesis n=1 Tax=Polymorphobacter multimanifer TaxID=1070431 RepID=A0A841L2P6_9SPHN|nr:flagellar biosynthesis anti-sigma factor FlgM [Polymorphobacter multimanifer]MBB6226700.1 negative regulator of flagellin synthesis FlgM [Polymorphobacter multimanifer]GGI82512.1 hypothetical protein GCM10007973_18660 [Polymorphobacter multimanifer]